jgi:hypothetical protein
VVAARADVMTAGPVPAILAGQSPEGWWDKPGHGYTHKYTGTVWSLSFLAQLGADPHHPQVRLATDYVLDHSRVGPPYGGFGVNPSPGRLIQCLQGNLIAALIRLGRLGDPRLTEAIEWLARSVTGEAIHPAQESKAAPRYYLSGNAGPGFLCAANGGLACAWGAIKAMIALAALPPADRTQQVVAAIERGVTYLLGRDPARADYEAAYSEKPSGSWFKFGYPLGYVSDVLQNAEALVALGYRHDPRLQPALALIAAKADQQGRWKMEYSYNGKMWADVERKGRPSKWVTLRALRCLRE